MAKKKLCDCGFPQSSPIPHEHSLPDPQPESEANTPSVPEGAALAKKTATILIAATKFDEKAFAQVILEAIEHFGRAQYERGVREAAEICDAVGGVEQRAVIWQLADRIRALLPPSEGATE